MRLSTQNHIRLPLPSGLQPSRRGSGGAAGGGRAHQPPPALRSASRASTNSAGVKSQDPSWPFRRLHMLPLARCSCAQPPSRAAASSTAELCTAGTTSDLGPEALVASGSVSINRPAISSRWREGMGPKLGMHSYYGHAGRLPASRGSPSRVTCAPARRRRPMRHHVARRLW